MNRELKLPSNRNFGITISSVLIIISLYLYIRHDYTNYYLYLVTLFFLFLGALNSKYLYHLNYVWFYIGIFLSKIVSPVILFAFYFFIFVPYGIFGRLFIKDIKEIRKKDNQSSSNWKTLSSKTDYERQF